MLLGGAVALLPVYASEILKTGPWGLGLLRSAPGVGAAAWRLSGASADARARGTDHVVVCGRIWSVHDSVRNLAQPCAFADCAGVDGGDRYGQRRHSRHADSVATPDEMRGRVNAVDMLFIGVSNELGQFESGLTAHWFGTVPAVVLGGIGTLVVIAIWAWKFPELRKADRLAGGSAS